MRKKALRILLAAAAAMTLRQAAAGRPVRTRSPETGRRKKARQTGKTRQMTANRNADLLWGSFEQIFYQRVSDAIESKAAEIEMNAIVTDAELDSHVASNKIESLVEQGCEAIALSCAIRMA